MSKVNCDKCYKLTETHKAKIFCEDCNPTLSDVLSKEQIKVVLRGLQYYLDINTKTWDAEKIRDLIALFEKEQEK
ncbi:MAG: hypothetical protein GY861_00935 [bacterium]|nr:hypothetical protein [bacterium]